MKEEFLLHTIKDFYIYLPEEYKKKLLIHSLSSLDLYYNIAMERYNKRKNASPCVCKKVIHNGKRRYVSMCRYGFKKRKQ